MHLKSAVAQDEFDFDFGLLRERVAEVLQHGHSENRLTDQVMELGRRHGMTVDFSTRVARMVAGLMGRGVRPPRITFDEGESEFHVQWFSGSRHVEISVAESDDVYVSANGFGNLSFSGFFTALPTLALARVLAVLASS